MKRFSAKEIAMFVILGCLVSLPLLGIADAQPSKNLKVNGEITGYVMGTLPDTLMLQTLSNLGSNTGSGSVHGINCRATMFFVYTVTPTGEFWTMTGQIVGTNMAQHDAYSWLVGLTIIIVVNSANSMTLTLTDNSNDVIFTGSGTPIIN